MSGKVGAPARGLGWRREQRKHEAARPDATFPAQRGAVACGHIGVELRKRRGPSEGDSEELPLEGRCAVGAGGWAHLDRCVLSPVGPGSSL